MIQSRDADLDAMLAGSGVPVVFGQLKGFGLLDISDEQVYSSEGATATVKKITLTVRIAAWPGLIEDATVTADGTVYRVISAHQMGDGRLAEVLLARS